jgi:mannose-6-phosphate isomerase-like protein (cupin superfamily)
LQTGLKLVGRKVAEKGEWRGTAIVDTSDEVASVGEMLIIPAGIAHQWLPEGEIPFSYFILKVHLARLTP